MLKTLPWSQWLLLVSLAASVPLMAPAQVSAWQPSLTRQQTYTANRASSADPTGANADRRKVDPGETLTVLDADGPGLISHIWFTIASSEPYHLKRIVLRIYWDGEQTPSVEAPIGDFFGLGLGYYYPWQSEMLSVGSVKDLNCFFPMPFERHARITLTNEGKLLIKALYYNIDWRTEPTTLAPGTLYFHAQYRQAQPNHGWTNRWTSNAQPLVNKKANLTGQDNYIWLDAKGAGQYAGVTMSILQNQDDWWGEGDDMFFVDGATKPSIEGTGAEDYFLGAWGFKDHPFSYQLYGAPIVGKSTAGGRTSVYRFHLDSPIVFKTSFKATIEHGNANHRSDNFYSVAYWYQAEPHAPFPTLPPVEQRLPVLEHVGGPGNAAPAAATPAARPTRPAPLKR
jgi:Protein of unknown function (DUF2961)